MMTTTLDHTYRPRGSADTVLSNRDAEVLVSGPAGTGKSRACLEKLNAAAMKYPGMRGLIVRKTAASLVTTALVTWHEHVISELLQAGAVSVYGGLQKPEKYTYWNGSTVLIAGMDKSTRIMSSEYDMIYVQEATELTEEDWEALTTRLRNGVIPYQQLLADCNPSFPTHWLKLRCERGTTTMLYSLHEENPRYFTSDGVLTSDGESYISKLDNLTGLRKARLRDGLWKGAEGTIFDEWDPAVHTCDRFSIPVQWIRYMAVDFGFTNPTVIQWWAEDPDGRLFLYREIYQTQTTVEELAKQALGLVTDDKGNWAEPKPRYVICDHDAENRATFEKYMGLGTLAANKTVLPGIEAVQGRLRLVNGKPRLQILKKSLVKRDPFLVEAKKPTCTEEEVLGYIWDIGVGKAPKEAPVKANDHGCDAMRYMVAHKDLTAEYRVRWL